MVESHRMLNGGRSYENLFKRILSSKNERAGCGRGKVEPFPERLRYPHVRRHLAGYDRRQPDHTARAFYMDDAFVRRRLSGQSAAA